MDEHETHSTTDMWADAETVLRKNDRGTHTVPSPGLYPHQWLWDSCFAAIGWTHIDPERARQELLSLVRGQWHNGMIPHIIFNTDWEYARDRGFWRSTTAPESNDHVATSGITQPPVLAEAVWRVGEALENHKRIAFYKKMLPHLVRYHEWLYRDRDPHSEGLVLLIHPYETGLDNTPPWMHQLHEHTMPWWISMLEKTRTVRIINLLRRDTRAVPAAQRGHTIDAILCWDMVRRLRRKHYNTEKILHRSLFCIEDVGYNAIFVRNNQILRDIASAARIRLPRELVLRIKESQEALESLWDEQFGTYFSRDFMSHRLLREPTIASLLPLYAGTIKPERAKKLVRIMTTERAFWLQYPLPSVPRNVRYFDANRYWQGPTWINMNWLIIDGLMRHGFKDEAANLRRSTLDMATKAGIWEYYNPHTGKGLGSPQFSWSAALLLDMHRAEHGKK